MTFVMYVAIFIMALGIARLGISRLSKYHQDRECYWRDWEGVGLNSSTKLKKEEKETHGTEFLSENANEKERVKELSSGSFINQFLDKVSSGLYQLSGLPHLITKDMGASQTKRAIKVEKTSPSNTKLDESTRTFFSHRKSKASTKPQERNEIQSPCISVNENPNATIKHSSNETEKKDQPIIDGLCFYNTVKQVATESATIVMQDALEKAQDSINGKYQSSIFLNNLIANYPDISLEVLKQSSKTDQEVNEVAQGINHTKNFKSDISQSTENIVEMVPKADKYPSVSSRLPATIMQQPRQVHTKSGHHQVA